MENYIKDVITLIFTPSAIVFGFIYILRKYFDNSLKKDLEFYKLELQTDYQKQVFEFQTKFSLFHEKQATIVADLYTKLVVSYQLLDSLTAPFQIVGGGKLTVRKKETYNTFIDFKDFFQTHRIYFSEELCQNLDLIIKKLWESYSDFDISQTGEDYEPDKLGGWREAWKKVKEEIPPIKKELEEYFRNILNYKISINNSNL